MRSWIIEHSTAKNDIDLYQNPWGARASKDFDKDELKLVAASLVINKKQAPAAIGVGSFEVAGKTVDGNGARAHFICTLRWFFSSAYYYHIKYSHILLVRLCWDHTHS